MCSILLRAGSGEDDADGAHDDLEIEPDAPVLDVGDIERNIAVERGILAALHLPETGDARRDIEAAQMVELVFHHFAGNRRTRTDHAHVAAQNIEELGQLVERVLAKETTDPGDAWIVGDLEKHAIALIHVHHVGTALFCIANHGSEFEAAEDTTFFADALGVVEDRSPAIQA